jgi:hypothetical protein
MAGLDLGKQVGPLPLGVWIAVGAGGLALGYVINKKMAASAAAATTQPSTGQLTETGVGTGGGQFIFDPPASGTVDTTPETNASWGRKATTWLIAQNHDPTLADQAVRKYLSALPLTIQEKATMALVMQHMGPPPEPLPPVEEEEDDTPSIPVFTKPASAVVGLHVNKGTMRNELVWIDTANPDGTVDWFKIESTNDQNGKSVQASINAIPGNRGTYAWTHTASPSQGVKTLPYTYTVTPMKGVLAGPPSAAKATMTI